MKELRKKLRLLRKSIDEPTRKKDGKKILHQCQKNGLFRSAKHIAIDKSKCDNKSICCVRALIYFPEPITYITGDEIGYYCASPSLNGTPTVSIELPP